MLDLHTTTAHGGIFTIPSPNEEARRIVGEIAYNYIDQNTGATEKIVDYSIKLLSPQ